MKAIELRIGNLVMFYGNNKPFRIDGINTDADPSWGDIGYVFRDNGEFVDSNKTNIEALEPIPLTEEWLLRFGFEKSLDYYIKTSSNFFFGITKDGQLMYLFDEEMTCPANISYVHSLQNLYFVLTGEELTF